MPTISTLTVDVQARTSKFGTGMRVAIGGLAALAAGAAFAFKKFEESENVMQQSAAVIKSTGGAANVTSKQVAELADTLSAKAGVDDEVIQAGENMLLTFKNITNEAGKNNDIFNQASVAALDMAAGFAAASGSEINLKASTIQLGKALNDPIAGMSALTRVGVQFTDQQERVITKLVESGNLLQAQKVILGEVTSQFQGSAAAQATASGTMKVAFENLAESIGAILAPAIEKLVGWVTTAADWFTNLDKDTQTYITTGAAVTAVVILISKAFGLLTPGVRATTIAFTTLAAHPIVAALIAFAAIVALVATNWDKMNGIVRVGLTVISPYGVALGILIRIFDDLKDTVLRWGSAVINALEKVGDFLGKVAGVVKDQFLGAWNSIKGPVLAVIGAIISAVQTLVGWIQDAIEWLGKLNPFASNAPGGLTPVPGRGPGVIPGAATGGFVARSGLAMIHQGENIVPAGVGMGGGDIVLQIDGQTFARITRDQLLKMRSSRGGTLGLA